MIIWMETGDIKDNNGNMKDWEIYDFTKRNLLDGISAF